jgi:hypothetical protein
MPHPLDGVKAKIERAVKHINQFDTEASRFERDAYTVRVEPDIDAGRLNLVTRDMGLGDPPVPLLLLAGEITYQLRSALDHIIYILAKQARERKRGFPIFKEPNEYKSQAPSMIKGVSARAEAIIEGAQPFQSNPPDNYALWMLHELNNTDKHRVIPACSVYASKMDINFGSSGDFINLEFMRRVPKDGAQFAHIPLPERYTPEMNMDSKTFSTVAFSEIADTKLEPVVPLLHQIMLFADGLFEQFMGEF